MARVYAFVNQKGGVGKTTTAINLGATLASLEQRVLLIDLDPQANATSSLGIDKNLINNGSYEVLIGSIMLTQNIRFHPKFKLSMLPASPALAGAEIELVNFSNREFRLQEIIAPSLERYDYILIDCPPSLSLLTINALVAASGGVIIPAQCEYLALEGLGQLIKTIAKIKTTLSPQLQVRGVVLTMFDGRTKLAIDVVNEVKKFFPKEVFHTIIPRSVRLAEAPSYGQPVLYYAPDSSAAKAYTALANEILDQDHNTIARDNG